MIVVQASHIAKQFDGHEVLQGATVVVQAGHRVGLIGANGAGKSTLLRILIGEMAADSGSVSVAKGMQLGYVAQFRVADERVTVFDFVAESFSDLFTMEDDLRRLEAQMANPSVYNNPEKFAEVTAQYDVLRHRFEEAGGYAAEARVRRVLDGLRFPVPMHRRPVSELSGGQKTRLALAKLLTTEPEILVLDEPTNYLDTDTMDWLEGYLRGYHGAILVVSHDRYFLDSIATDIVELESGKTTSYVGNYSDYLEQKAAQLESDLKRYEAQQEEIKRIETFVQKNIVRASTTKRAQSRRKYLEKMTRMDRPSTTTPRMAVRFSCARESGKDVLRAEDLKVGFPGHPMPTDRLNLYVARGQRLAILGPNGIGKTTLLKTLIGTLAPLSGSVMWGQHVAIGYYDQEQTALDNTKTVLDLIWDEHRHLDVTTIRTALGRFLFRGESVNTPVAMLSGGERSRLALCQLMLRQPNVLVMDEPTNHLDLLAKEVLEDALADYEGTIVMVSHDRYFIDAVASHVLTLGEAGSKLYIGNYSDYVTKRDEDLKWAELEGETSFAAKPESTAGVSSNAVNQPSSKNSRQVTDDSKATKPRMVRSADIRKLHDKIASIEARISEIESRQGAIGELFADPETVKNPSLAQQLQIELDGLTLEHDAQLEAWEALSLELETLES